MMFSKIFEMETKLEIGLLFAKNPWIQSGLFLLAGGLITATLKVCET